MILTNFKRIKKKIKQNFNKILSNDNFYSLNDDKSNLLLNDSEESCINKDNNNDNNKIKNDKNKLIMENKILQENNIENIYQTPNLKQLFGNMLVNIKDADNEIKPVPDTNLDSLIIPVGEEAEVKPRLYENTTQGTERINKKIILVDSGTGALSTITNLGTNNWHKFKVDLQDTINISNLSDIYLKSITVINAAPAQIANILF